MDTKDLVTIIRQAFLTERTTNVRLNDFVVTRTNEVQLRVIQHFNDGNTKSWSVIFHED